MQSDMYPTSLPSRRKGFWFGFFVALSVCTLLAFLALLCTGQLNRLAHAALESFTPAPPPPYVDLDAARARLNKSAGTKLTFPFPVPQIIVNQSYSELDLYYGERFVKRYDAVERGAERVPPATTPCELTSCLTGCGP